MNLQGTKPRAAVYIDGFNLYRRLLAGYPECKWLDLEVLMDRVLPDYDVASVAYFTAMIKPLPGKDPSSPQRQQAYLRALATCDRTVVYLGKFRIDTRVMPIHPIDLLPDGKARTVKVKKMEEKGSDVALASRLLVDAAKGNADTYVVCTNDSDLVMPLRLVGEEFGGEVGLLSPVQPKRASNELKQTRPVWHRSITPDDLHASQFPAEMTDGAGTIRRPTAWS